MSARLVCFFLYFFSLILVFGQGSKVNNGKLNGLEGNRYLDLAQQALEVSGNQDSFYYYSFKALNIAKQTADKDSEIKSCINLAKYQWQKANLDSAISIYLNINLSDNLNTKYLPDIKAGLGSCYYRQDKKEMALKCFMEAIKGYTQNGNIDGLALMYSKMADISEMNGDYIECQKYRSLAVSLIPRMTNDYSKVQVYNILAGVYLFTRHLNITYLDSSLNYANLSLNLTLKNGFGSMFNTAYFNISDVYLAKEDFRKAIEFNLKTIPYRKYLSTGEVIMFYNNMADCNYYLKQYDESLIYLDSVKQTLKYIKGNYYLMYYYKRLYLCQREKGQYEESLKSYENYTNVKDSLYNIEKSTAINELNQKYSKAENERKISELNLINEKTQTNNKILFWAVLSVVLFVIVMIGYYRSRLLANRMTQIETEQRLNRARMNPHFFFNALTSIQNLVLNDSKRDLVPDFISMFSKIMRQSLESTFNELDTIESEIAFLTDYMKLQQLRSENRFSYNFQTNDVQISDLLVPTMILQPFIENSIEHGFKNNSEPGKIDISFDVSGDLIYIKILDNGTGFRGKEESKTYPSRATQIIRDRLFLLNKQYKTNAIFVINEVHGGGIEVVITLPVIYKT